MSFLYWPQGTSRSATPSSSVEKEPAAGCFPLYIKNFLRGSDFQLENAVFQGPVSPTEIQLAIISSDGRDGAACTRSAVAKEGRFWPTPGLVLSHPAHCSVLG